MKAMVIDRFEGPEQIVRRGLPRPQPLDDQVLIQVVAAGISRLDASACRGDARGSIAVAFPWVPGFEIAGVVEQLGPACRRFRAGDRVCALLPAGGGYAQFATVEESRVAPMPAALLFEEAAALPLSGFAAWHALRGAERGRVLVHGASTGAGHYAVQIGLALGARVFVDAPAGHREFVEQLGGVEWIVGGDEPAADLRIDASSGSPGDGWVDLGGGPESVQASVLASNSPHEHVAGLLEMIEKRRVRPRLFKIMNLGSATDAHRTLESGSAQGKLVLNS